jgi:hypothetical protein
VPNLFTRSCHPIVITWRLLKCWCLTAASIGYFLLPCISTRAEYTQFFLLLFQDHGVHKTSRTFEAQQLTMSITPTEQNRWHPIVLQRVSCEVAWLQVSDWNHRSCHPLRRRVHPVQIWAPACYMQVTRSCEPFGSYCVWWSFSHR